MGRRAWDRFQTLGGIQYYFDTEFQLLRGHMYYSGTEWALSSINQHGLWERRPTLDRDGHVSVLSVDIGDFNTPSNHLVDEFGRGKAARDCTADEIAAEVWRQIVAALTSNVDNAPEELLPWPVWYALDRGLVLACGPGQGAGRVVRNETPYLVPIVGDWLNRPGGHPWNPHDTSWTYTPPEDYWLEDLEQRNVWQARHGGYQVHNNSVVFAGTWTKTFTRMTSMEAACESARHAVNAILDHFVWVESGGVDRRENTTLGWRFPYGFIDQGFSSPIRMPTPAGDYCYVFDIENREPPDTRVLRNLDAEYCQESLPHPLDTPAPTPAGPPTSPVPLLTGGQPMTIPPMDYGQQLLSYLQAWRQLPRTVDGDGCPGCRARARLPAMPGMPPAMPGMPPVPPFMPPMPPTVRELHRWRHRRSTTPSSCSPTCRPGGTTSSRQQARRPGRRRPPRRRRPAGAARLTPAAPVPRRPDVPAGSRRVESGIHSAIRDRASDAAPVASGDSLASSDSPDRSGRDPRPCAPPDVLRGPASRVRSFFDDLGRYRRVRDATRAARV